MEAAEKKRDTEFNPADISRRKVLIADDQSINREILGVILKEDYDVLYAENGKEALDIMKDQNSRISAVLLDLSMPVMDGYEVLRAMQDDEALAGIPVLVATQRDGDEEEIKALSLGAVDFLTKPYKPEIIKYRVEKTIMLRESASMLDMVERDPVSGLYTKEFFYSYVERILSENSDKDFDLLEVNIDKFKLVNDLYGRNAGNKLLKSLGDILKGNIHELGGFSSRIIADDFISILPHRDDYDSYLPTLFSQLEKSKELPNVKLRFGIYCITKKDIPVNTMCDRVTMATTEAKNQFNTPVVYYDESMRQKLMDDQMLTSSMQEAIDTHQFKVYFQPKYDIASGKLAGAEALVRWIHPERGFLSPGTFIPLFESNGLIYKLDRFVWEETCRTISMIKKKYGSCVPISVNISRVDVYDPKLPDILEKLIKKYDVDPRELHLEITESAYTRDPKQLIAIVDKLRSIGFLIEMDDFGSGFSSLNMLSKLSVDVLKLDMIFLREGNFTKEDPGILKYIMEISQWMKVPVVAEGVETAEQVEMLKSLNCAYAQGSIMQNLFRWKNSKNI